MKLCTVIAYYITSITKQLKFLHSHCSIVCSCCSVVCLIAKYGLKLTEFSSSLKLNEIHRVDSPFNEDAKHIIFSREVLISGEGRPENVGKMGINRGIYCYANRGLSISEEISVSTPWYQNLCDASIFLYARSNFRIKN